MKHHGEQDGYSLTEYRNRRRQQPNPRTGKKRGPLIDETFVINALKEIDKLEQETRPNLDQAASGKDLAAFSALKTASWLVKMIAGWAIDHQRGLAAQGLSFVPLGTTQTKVHPEYLKKRTAVDSHEHEKCGGNLAELSPTQERQFVINLLRPMIPHLGLSYQIIEALEALDYGETLPILRKALTSKRTGLTEYRAKLFAVAFIEYQHTKGIKKHVSTETVATLYAVSKDAVKDWPSEVRGALGDLEVDRELSFARNCAQNFIHETQHSEESEASAEWFDNRYGLPALKKIASRYKARKRL